MPKNNGDSNLEKLVHLLKENFGLIVLPLIAIVILASGIYLYSKQKSQVPVDEGTNLTSTSTYQESSTTEEKQNLTEDQTSKDKSVSGTIEQNKNTRKLTNAQETNNNNGYVFHAKAGEGITNLARIAIKSYLLNDESGSIYKEKLNAEHKIFVEDYLKDKTGSRLLKIGETVSFDKNLIKQGIEKSLTLSSNQLKNLKQFTLQVHSFNLNY